jgi:signal transduction histidine kinase
VADYGIGIPKNQQQRIFEKFFRAENALKAVPEGSGLGLSLVKSLVEEWHGKVWFETEEGKGTKFIFTIPLSGMKAKAGDVSLTV